VPEGEPAQGYPTAPPRKIIGGAHRPLRGCRRTTSTSLPAEHAVDGEKEERWLPQAFEEPLEEDEEPFEPESRVVLSPEKPYFAFDLSQQATRLVIPRVNQIVTRPICPCKLKPNKMTGACFVRYDSKKQQKQPPRSVSSSDEQRLDTYQDKPTRRSFFSIHSASTVSIRISANRTVVASHTEAHATSLSPSACFHFSPLYYYA
jgi:hypothetical protein